MKLTFAVLFTMALGMAFADGKGCCGGQCDSKTFKAQAFDAKDAQFLALANAMANGGTKAGSCVGKEKAAKACCKAGAHKTAKKSAKKAKR